MNKKLIFKDLLLLSLLRRHRCHSLYELMKGSSSLLLLFFPNFLFPKCLSAIPQRQSHYLSTQAHADINNSHSQQENEMMPSSWRAGFRARLIAVTAVRSSVSAEAQTSASRCHGNCLIELVQCRFWTLCNVVLYKRGPGDLHQTHTLILTNVSDIFP